jgi:DNA-3-methyladenine glycosylase II
VAGGLSWRTPIASSETAQTVPRHPHHTALKKLAAVDPHIAGALELVGLPPPRHRPPGFESLARIIVAQQVSVAAAKSIWERLTTGIAPFTPESVVLRTVDDLRSFGLSRQKAAYTWGLASDLAAGRVDLEHVHAMEDEVAIAELTKIKGFGRWSAEVYLLFSLGRLDVFPAADLGLAVAMQRLRKLRKRPDAKRLIKLAEPWRPYRGAAAHFLWHYHSNAPLAGNDR